VLAATLSSLYGIYSGYELCENVPALPTSEEYLSSEKYEIKARDFEAPGNLVDLVTQVNAVRRANRALQLYRNLRFYQADNPYVLWYGKATESRDNVIFVAANMDPTVERDSFVDVPIDELGIGWDEPYKMHELLSDRVYEWVGPRGFIKLYPSVDPAQIFRLERYGPAR
jgi:starch synthase (maltosyl-transferring)